MRKFKLFFYPIYILVIALVLYFSIDIMMHRDAYMAKVDFSIIKKLPGYTIVLLLFLSTLMSVEIIIENIQQIRLKSRLKAKEKEVLELKAKLYDKGQAPEAPSPEEGEAE